MALFPQFLSQFSGFLVWCADDDLGKNKRKDEKVKISFESLYRAHLFQRTFCCVDAKAGEVA